MSLQVKFSNPHTGQESPKAIHTIARVELDNQAQSATITILIYHDQDAKDAEKSPVGSKIFRLNKEARIRTITELDKEGNPVMEEVETSKVDEDGEPITTKIPKQKEIEEAPAFEDVFSMGALDKRNPYVIAYEYVKTIEEYKNATDV